MQLGRQRGAVEPRTLMIGGGILAGLLVAAGVVYAVMPREPVAPPPAGGGMPAPTAAAPAVPTAASGAPGTYQPGAVGGTGGYAAAPQAGAYPTGSPAPSDPGALPPGHGMATGGIPAGGTTSVQQGWGGGENWGAYGQNPGAGYVEPGTPLKPGDPGWDARSGSDNPAR